jgi:hypothetical protein
MAFMLILRHPQDSLHIPDFCIGNPKIFVKPILRVAIGLSE